MIIVTTNEIMWYKILTQISHAVQRPSIVDNKLNQNK